MSLDRLHLDEHAQAVAYAARSRLSHGGAHPTAPPIDPKEFLARVVMHIPEPRRHVIRYYGAYSSVVRARRRREAPATVSGQPAQASPPMARAAQSPTDPDLRALRRRWAQLIRRIYEVDPLVCPRCGRPMHIIAFITEPRVITKILRHLTAMATESRGPPRPPDDIEAA